MTRKEVRKAVFAVSGGLRSGTDYYESLIEFKFMIPTDPKDVWGPGNLITRMSNKVFRT